jgi:nicotinate-nucleotide--dimethylbenzimidazole phosphoribosyltransferase
VVSEQQEHPEGAVAAQEPTQPEQPAAAEQAPQVDPPAAAEAPQAEQPAEAAAPTEQPAEAAPSEPGEQPAAPAAEAAPQDEAVGPKIVGVAKEPKKLPVVRKRLQEKPKREPLPWPELRAAVAATKDGLDVNELKELFRQFPEKLRAEVTENVRGFQKGARRPVSQHAAKQLARASHTARRMKKNAAPSGEVAEALGQAMAAELIASLEPEKAAQVILPKRDLLERENRQAQRRARDEEDKRRDEQRRKRREDAKSSRQQTSFGGGFAGAKIKGLDELAALFAEQSPAEPEPVVEPEAPVAEAPAAEVPAAEPEAPVTPATTSEPEESQPAPEIPAGEPEAPVTPATTSEPAAEPEPGDAA